MDNNQNQEFNHGMQNSQGMEQQPQPMSAPNMPQYDPSYAPQYNPAYAPQYNPAYAPQYNPAYAPQYDQANAPQYNPAYAPQYGQANAPQYNPAYAPQYDQSYAPAYQPMPTPDAAPAPESAPESKPTTESAPVPESAPTTESAPVPESAPATESAPAPESAPESAPEPEKKPKKSKKVPIIIGIVAAVAVIVAVVLILLLAKPDEGTQAPGDGEGSTEGGGEVQPPEDDVVYSEGLEFTLSDDGKSYYVSGIGECTDTDIVIPDKYKRKPVTTISYGAFAWNDNITSVTTGSKMKEIGSSAFGYCTSLTTVTLGSGTTSIGDSAFSGCTSLRAITIPDGMESIYNNAFDGCSSLAEIELPDSISYIGGHAFRGCSSLESVTIPAAVTSISAYTFHECTSLKEVSIHDGVTYIGEAAFAYCSSLTEVAIPAETIDWWAFCNCESLVSVTLGENVYNIYSEAFLGCDKLLEVVNNSSLDIEPGSYAYGYIAENAVSVHSGESTLENIDGYIMLSGDGEAYLLGYTGNETDLVLPESYNGGNYIIYNSAFSNRDDITSVVISNRVTQIQQYAFYGCDNLFSVVVGDRVATIGDYAFQSCDKLTTVTLGSSVNSIGYDAFYDCAWLYEVVNNSKLGISTDSWSYGYVAYYADSVHSGTSLISLSDGYVFFDGDDGKYLIRYIGDETDIVLPESLNGESYMVASSVFRYNSNIESVTISDGVLGIGTYAFGDCTALKSVTMGANVSYIHSSAFYNTAIKEVNVNDIASWCAIHFANQDSNPLSYGAKLYVNGVLLTDLVIPDGVQTVSQYAFYGYKYLVTLGLGNTVQTVGTRAFYDCSNLVGVVLGGSVSTINDYAFYGCNKLLDVVNYSGLYRVRPGYTSHGYVAYYTDSVSTTGRRLVDVDGYLFYPYYGAYYLVACRFDNADLVLPESVNGEKYYIYKDAFRNRDDIKSVVISDNVVYIDESAFYDCDSLISVVIGDSVETIASYAFYNCDSLASVTLGNAVDAMGYETFYGCTNLVEVVNNSSLYITAGSSDWGYVAYYAATVHSGESSLEEIDGFLFGMVDGEAYLFKYLGDESDIVLPDSYNGQTYTVASSAFADCYDIYSLTVSSGVKKICAYALDGFYNIDSITFEITDGWYVENYYYFSYIDSGILSDPYTAKNYLTYEHSSCDWVLE